MNEIHFHESLRTVPTDLLHEVMCHGWNETAASLGESESIIHTLQMGLLDTWPLDHEYRIFIHPVNDGCKYNDDKDKVYEIKYGKNDWGDYIIKPGDDIFQLWKSGKIYRRWD